MIKKTSVALLAMTATITASGAEISPEAALQRLSADTGMQKKAGIYGNTLSLQRTIADSKGEATLYLFADAAKSGFVILSADDMAQPVLGYADSGTLPDEENMPEQMKWWLGEYTAQIEAARNAGLQPSGIKKPGRKAERAAIAPMLKTTWDQGDPYNSLCPVIRSTRTYTGCVATAMAQVMNYHQYPAKGQGSISYQCSSLGKRISLDFSKQEFKWNDMLDSYAGTYTDEQANAVATLMRACGYSVQMNFSTSGSGALSLRIAPAMMEYFNYSPSARYDMRSFHTTDSWFDLIYGSLAAGAPVIYDGQAPTGGHSFVCDGYNGDGMFHFNWGWSGVGNGYFILDALDPLYEGIGGFAGGYNSLQDAITYALPLKEGDTPALRQLCADGELEAEIAGNILTLSSAGWYNMSCNNLRASVAVEFVKINSDNTYGTPVYLPVQELDNDLNGEIDFPLLNGFNEVSVDLSAAAALDRTASYKVRPVTKDLDQANPQWVPMLAPPAYVSEVVINFGNGNEILPVDGKAFVVSDLSVDSEVHIGDYIKVHFTVTNPTNEGLTMSLYPAIFDSTLTNALAQGTGFLLSLAPGESKTYNAGLQMQYTGSIANGTPGTLWLYDNNIGYFYDTYADVTILDAVDYNCVPANFTVNSPNGEVSDKMAIPFTADITCTEGYMANALYIAITPKNSSDVLTYAPTNPLFIANGESGKLDCTIPYMWAADGSEYNALLCRVEKNQLVPLVQSANGQIDPGCICSFKYVAPPQTAVEEVETAGSFTLAGNVLTAEAAVSVFAIDGRKTADVKAGGSVMLEKGIYIVKSEGATSKIIVR